ncbi:hypothetical protein KJB29_15960 [Geobacter grbiciae]|nr:hypothetical protein [Geobacter grbiciae]MBT1076739.1 hypothetical protein [Geobacter grbiciae]
MTKAKTERHCKGRAVTTLNVERQNGKILRLSRSEKYQRLVDMLNDLSSNEFTGYIKVNFSQGGIGRIEKFEEISFNRAGTGD